MSCDQNYPLNWQGSVYLDGLNLITHNYNTEGYHPFVPVDMPKEDPSGVGNCQSGNCLEKIRPSAMRLLLKSLSQVKIPMVAVGSYVCCFRLRAIHRSQATHSELRAFLRIQSSHFEPCVGQVDYCLNKYNGLDYGQSFIHSLTTWRCRSGNLSYCRTFKK